MKQKKKERKVSMSGPKCSKMVQVMRRVNIKDLPPVAR